ncbi:MAG: hypothetical protein HC797_10185, partial [Anaerolineales bacterium]|nr:hypothetical protein [Anaerolineales bacterium]
AGQNQLPNLEKFIAHGGYSRLDVCSPPQTEVSWTSIATGTDPGGHGIFDFVHRDPATYIPYVSILPTKTSAIGEQFIPPYTANTFFPKRQIWVTPQLHYGGPHYSLQGLSFQFPLFQG